MNTLYCKPGSGSTDGDIDEDTGKVEGGTSYSDQVIEDLHELEEQSWDDAYGVDRSDIRNGKAEGDEDEQTVDKPKDESEEEPGADDVEIVC